MDPDMARDFLKQNHRAVLVTYKRDGSVQTTPVSAAVDGDGYAIISSRETAYKTRNLRRDPRATLCVMNDGFYGRWIQVVGRAEIVSLPEAMEPLVDYYRRAGGEHPDWDDYRAAMQKQQRCLIRIQIERAGPDRAG
ncbi:MAG: PPOX class F420-dependent oxidoreductase [Actinomycetota bacterium]|jgi:PPOX class probable F420-dependent enzyme